MKLHLTRLIFISVWTTLNCVSTQCHHWTLPRCSFSQFQSDRQSDSCAAVQQHTHLNVQVRIKPLCYWGRLFFLSLFYYTKYTHTHTHLQDQCIWTHNEAWGQVTSWVAFQNGTVRRSAMDAKRRQMNPDRSSLRGCVNSNGRMM